LLFFFEYLDSILRGSAFNRCCGSVLCVYSTTGYSPFINGEMYFDKS
jgi:hypothetical protein